MALDTRMFGPKPATWTLALVQEVSLLAKFEFGTCLSWLAKYLVFNDLDFFLSVQSCFIFVCLFPYLKPPRALGRYFDSFYINRNGAQSVYVRSKKNLSNMCIIHYYICSFPSRIII